MEERKVKNVQFTKLVPFEVDNAKSGGKRKSKNNETWTANAFNE